MPLDHKRAVSYDNTNVQSFPLRTIPWVWQGVLAEGAITLLSAPEKTGKTTLLSLLLDRRREGGYLLGQPVLPGRTILCTEEESILWRLRQPPLDFGPHLEFHHPLGDRPTFRRWRRYIDHLLELGDDYFNLLVIDTAGSFLPAAHNQSDPFRRALKELRVIATLPATVLLLHQTCSLRSRSRARGLLPAFADILIDMQLPPGNRLTRRRHFLGVGRYPGTLQSVTAELNLEGTNYRVLPEGSTEAEQSVVLEVARRILSESMTSLTRQEILARWPEAEPAPRADSLWRTLSRGCEQGILVRSGAGTRAEAFRYGLAQA